MTISLILAWIAVICTFCFLVSVLLGASYLIRKVFKKNWMNIHRILNSSGQRETVEENQKEEGDMEKCSSFFGLVAL